MIVTFFSSKPYDERYFKEAGKGDRRHEMVFQEARLTAATVALAKDSEAVCVFVNDRLDREVLEKLKAGGTRIIALRCAGFNNVDLQAAAELGLPVVRVPAYSPHAVAEHTLALLLALNRRIHRAYNRVREGNFSLNGLTGFDLHGLTVGIVGTGKIGAIVARIFAGFGCKLLCSDVRENPDLIALGARYAGVDRLFAEADIISLHCPLTPETHHLIDAAAIARMKRGVTLINTSRGALVDTAAVIKGLKSGHIGNLGIDVYEEEDSLFFEDLSDGVIQDDTFARLLTFPNVLITGHQAFFTDNALRQIARTTLDNLREIERTGECANRVYPDML